MLLRKNYYGNLPTQNLEDPKNYMQRQDTGSTFQKRNVVINLRISFLRMV